MGEEIKYPYNHLNPVPEGEEIVISGISGRFPNSDNVKDFMKNLFDKVDLVVEDDRRWSIENPEISKRGGKLNKIDKFDANFFGVHFKQAHAMDPMCRMILEGAYEAVIDAGINPKEFRGSNTGVFIGAGSSESEKTWFYEKIQLNGFGITGCSRAMLANRVSYWLGTTGPSYALDSSCSSSLYALEQAYKSIRDGECEAAVVGGTNVTLHPFVSLQFSRLGVLSKDGIIRPFDENGNGYVRSEAITCIVLQKAKNAYRAYAQVCHAKTNHDGYKPEGITRPIPGKLEEFLRSFYEEYSFPPEKVDFLEACGKGIKYDDTAELNSIESIFCKNRKNPLRIGTVKSNIGHTEAASGLCSVIKAIFALETNYIPPNINYETPISSCKGLIDGRIQVVTEKTPFDGEYAAINSFGTGGSNCHILLKKFSNEKINFGLPEDNIPRLVCVSGRTEEAVNVILDELESVPLDAEYCHLFHKIHEDEMSGHIYRGYTLLQKSETDTLKPICLSRKNEHFPGDKRPIWFVFSGMGSQWPEMGKSLMKIPTFAKAIEKCNKVLEPKGVDIYKIITENDPKIFDNILNSFIGIAAVQIGLVDILNSLNIYPDFIIGHSVGELGCAYADGCFTAEQMILAAYSRGIASVETELIIGCMAAVGMGYKDIRPLCPPEIDVACHNSAESCTISGPEKEMLEFIKDLSQKSIFVRKVNTANIAYHSRYIANAGPRLLQELKKVIPEPKLRSEKWISTSVGKSDWNSNLAKYSSAEYHTNNLLSSVLFEESARNIQPDAICIEIAPHGLMQAILKRSLPSTVTNIPLTQKGTDNSITLLNALGRAYIDGLHPKIANIYPEIKHPISRDTPTLSHLVRWEHSQNWFVALYEEEKKIQSGENTFLIGINEKEYNYLQKHVIDGRILFPPSKLLKIVWETLGLVKGVKFTDLPVVFENVYFLRSLYVPKHKPISLTVMVQKGTGNFEVIENKKPIVTGRIYVPTNINKEMAELPLLKVSKQENQFPLTQDDIYKEFKIRGYDFDNEFKGVKEIDSTFTVGSLDWNENWVTFFESMIHLAFLREKRGLYTPKKIQKLTINCESHIKQVNKLKINQNEKPAIPVYHYQKLNIIKTKGIEIRGIKVKTLLKRSNEYNSIVEKYNFIPYNIENKEIKILEAIYLCVQLALENSSQSKIKVVEKDSQSSDLIAPIIQQALNKIPLVEADFTILSSKQFDLPKTFTVKNTDILKESNVSIIVDQNLLNHEQDLNNLLQVLKPDFGFILLKEKSTQQVKKLSHFDIITEINMHDEKIVLLKQKKIISECIVINVASKPQEWLDPLKQALKLGVNVIICAQNQPFNGILGLVNCLRKELGGENIRCVFINDPNAPQFDPNIPFYKEQLIKNLVFNVYKNGTWGSYRYLNFEEKDVLVKHSYAKVSKIGDLSSVKWFEGPYNYEDKDLIEVFYSSLNYRDILTADGKITKETTTSAKFDEDCLQGIEFSGKDLNGQRYLGLVEGGAISSKVIANKKLLWVVPNNWSLEEAATIPLSYGLAIYALKIIARAVPGQSILIHSGCGGLGQAAINYSLFHGLNVFTTVGSPEKKELIKKIFPQLKDNQITSSRDTLFEQFIRKQTNGVGVDIVLNSLSGDKTHASIRSLSKGGKLLQVNQYDMMKNDSLGMETFLRRTSIFGVVFENVLNDDDLKEQLHKEIFIGLKSGFIKPLVRQVFDKHELQKAFYHLKSGKHIGKVVIKIRDDVQNTLINPEKCLFKANSRFYCDPSKSYVIFGNLNVIELELGNYLVDRGAKKLVLVSHDNITTGYQSLILRLWKEKGVDVIFINEDTKSIDGCKSALQKASELGQVDAIFNLRKINQYSILEKQTKENFELALTNKVKTILNLDSTSRKMCPLLRYFVVFSSIVSGRGNIGQTSQALADSMVERICEQRKLEGLPSLVIQWGPIKFDETNDSAIEGTIKHSIPECLEKLDIFLKNNEPIVESMIISKKNVSRNVVEFVAKLLGFENLNNINLDESLEDIGVNTKIALDIKEALEREFEIFLPFEEIKKMSFSRLQSKFKNYFNSNAHNINVDYLQILIKLIAGYEDLLQHMFVNLPNNSHLRNDKVSLFMVPGLEGSSHNYLSLTKNLEFKTYGLQFGLTETLLIKGIAEKLAKVLESNLKENEDFNIIAYSYGCLIALEIAHILELNGRKGKIILIDGAPFLFKRLYENLLEISVTEQELQKSLLCSIMSQLDNSIMAEFEKELSKCSTWDSKKKYFTTKVPNTFKLSTNNQIKLCDSLLTKIKALEDYNETVEPKLKSDLHLIRTKVPIIDDIVDDYKLNNHTDKNIKVYKLDGTHQTILDNNELINIINQILS